MLSCKFSLETLQPPRDEITTVGQRKSASKAIRGALKVGNIWIIPGHEAFFRDDIFLKWH